MKKMLKAILPVHLQKLLWRLSCRLRGVQPISSHRISFSGDYCDWNSAKAECSGYEAPNILEKVRSATLKVKNGEAAFERDSVIFSKPQYSWPLLAALMCAAAEHSGRLAVVDFGGSLGSVYFQYRNFFRHIPALQWKVVEQPHFVEVGQTEIAEGSLSFSSTVEEALAGEDPQVLLLSGVLQCLPNPHQMLPDLLSRKWSHVVVDRTAFVTTRSSDRLTIEHVPPSVYEASYPAWFFADASFRAHFDHEYVCAAEWLTADRYGIDGDETAFRGMLFRRRSEEATAKQ